MRKEKSCINSRAILEYVRDHTNVDCSALVENLDPELDDLPDPEGFLREPNNWVPCGVVSKLFERARLMLHDDMAAYKIAKYALEETSLGYPQRIIVESLCSYRQVLKNFQQLNDKWNRTKKVELVEMKRNRAIVRLHWDPQIEVTKDICLYNQGIYTFTPYIWDGRPLSLSEACCYFEGAPYCEYRLKWPARNRLYEVISRFFSSRSFLSEAISQIEKDKQVIEREYEEVNRLNAELNQRVNQLLALQETGKRILSVLDLEQLVAAIMNTLSNVCKVKRALIMLVNDEDACLEFMHGAGFGGPVPEEVRNLKIPLTCLDNILVGAINKRRSVYAPRIKGLGQGDDGIMLPLRSASVYAVPLITRSKVIGVIATDAAGEKGIPKGARETLEIFAQQMAIAIENAGLYSKLQEKMTELKKSQALLSRAEKFSFLGNLAARLAHEIKNPMTAIETFMQMLPRKFDDKEFRENFYKIAMEETTRVNGLISELLDLVKTKRPHLEFHDFHDLIDRMILLISPQSNAKGIKVIREFDSSVGQVWLDSEKIKQVILNILSNAVEFTPKGGRIKVLTRRFCEAGRPDSIRIEIRDNGIGISESMMNKIFDPYFTTKHKSNINNGTGLGLFITHQAMEDHGGSIEVESVPDEGATFVLILPAEPTMKLSQNVFQD